MYVYIIIFITESSGNFSIVSSTTYYTDIGYSQGMNDILARFLVVTDSEIDSYWMFCLYMEKKRPDFLEDTMMCKICMLHIQYMYMYI